MSPNVIQSPVRKSGAFSLRRTGRRILCGLLAVLPVFCLWPAAAQDRVFSRKAAALYTTPPDLKSCRPGVLAAMETQRALSTLNAIRALHGLSPVAYDASADEAVMRISLMIAVNRQVSHAPSQDWRCYAPDGYLAAQTSNLGGGFAPALIFRNAEDYVTGWLTEMRNGLPDSIGHRRWLLDPFLKKIAYGRVAGILAEESVDGAAIRISYPGEAYNTDFTGDFVSYPFQDYPEKFYQDGAMLSFSVVASRDSLASNRNVNFADALVTVARNGQPLPVSDISFDNSTYGLPNSIQFRAGKLVRGALYSVAISGVMVGGERRDYSYWFRIVSAPEDGAGKSRIWKAKPSSSPAPRRASVRSPR